MKNLSITTTSSDELVFLWELRLMFLLIVLFSIAHTRLIGQVYSPCQSLDLDSTFAQSTDSIRSITLLKNAEFYGSRPVHYYYESYIGNNNITSVFFNMNLFKAKNVQYMPYFGQEMDSTLNGNIRIVGGGLFKVSIISYSFEDGFLVSMIHTEPKDRVEYHFQYINKCRVPIVIEIISSRRDWKWHHSIKYYVFTNSDYQVVEDLLFSGYLHTLLDRR
jgi:hypothetical protein